MLSKSLDVVDHEEWIAEFGEALANQIQSYAKYSEEKVQKISLLQFLAHMSMLCSW